MGLIDKLQSRLELYRLEQRYTRRKNRPVFSTGALYVDGEYIYSYETTPSSSTKPSKKKSSGSSSGSSDSSDSNGNSSSSPSPVSLSKHSTGSGMGMSRGDKDFWTAPEERRAGRDADGNDAWRR